MPTYDYVCDDCGHAFEEFQYFNEEVLKVCPKCEKSTLRRLFGTGAAVLFKGSGFYETDYRSDSYKESAKKDSQSSKPSNTSSSPSTSESSTKTSGSTNDKSST